MKIVLGYGSMSQSYGVYSHFQQYFGCSGCKRMVVVSSSPDHDEVYPIQHYVIVCHIPTAGHDFPLGTLVSSTNKTYRHDIAEILLKMAINTITLTH
jgi:hypothetical protein